MAKSGKKIAKSAVGGQEFCKKSSKSKEKAGEYVEHLLNLHKVQGAVLAKLKNQMR